MSVTPKWAKAAIASAATIPSSACKNACIGIPHGSNGVMSQAEAADKPVLHEVLVMLARSERQWELEPEAVGQQCGAQGAKCS